MKLTHLPSSVDKNKERMHEARIKLFFLKQSLCSFFFLFFDIMVYSNIHTTKYSVGHESFVKMNKNTAIYLFVCLFVCLFE